MLSPSVAAPPSHRCTTLGLARSWPMTRAGRLREFEQPKWGHVYDEMPSAQSWGRSTKAPRRRRGVRQVGGDGFLRLREATAPTAAIRTIISQAASKLAANFLAIYDVSAASSHADVHEDIVVWPPEGTSADCTVWQLREATCGTRHAGRVRLEFLARVFKEPCQSGRSSMSRGRMRQPPSMETAYGRQARPRGSTYLARCPRS